MKRFVCWFLCLSVLFSLLPVIPAAPVIAQGEVPNLVYAGYIDWEGVNPAAGDDTFYMEYYGTGLSELTAVICLATYNPYTYSYDYTPVASQVDKGIPLKDNDGKDRYLFKMGMDGGKVLEEGVPYHILMRDIEGKYYTPSISTYFTVEAQPYYPSVFGFQPVEIASNTQSVFLSLQTFGFAKDLTAQDFTVELVVAERMNWGSGNEQEVPVPAGVLPVAGTMQDIVAYKIENGAYQLEGDVVLNPLNYSAGQSLFARVTGKSAHGTEQQPNRTKYSMSPIFVIDHTKPTPSQFIILNSLPIVTFDPEQGHHHDTTGYMKADSKHNFAIGTGDTMIYFELTGTGLSDPGKLSANLNGASVTLQQISGEDQGNGLKSVHGSILLPVNEEGTLSILYDGMLYHQTTLSRYKGTNENGTTDLDLIDLYMGAPEIPAGGSFQIYLGYPMNLTLGENMFSVSMTDLNKRVIPLQVTETLEQGLLTLTCVTPELLSGQYSLNVFYDQQPLQACSSFMGIVDFYVHLESTLIFKNTDNQTSLSYISQIHGNIQINGMSFDSNVQYTARFIPRGTSSLNPTVISFPTTFQSDSLLVVEKALADTLPLGWYTVYLTIGDTLVNGFADTAIIPQMQLVMPTVTIEGDYTDKRDITLKGTFGSYQKVKIAESLADLSFSPWLTSIPETYMLSEGYGEKTLYFLFETSEGDQVTLSDSITYINATLDPVQFFGIAGANLAADIYIVNKALTYSLYFTHTQPDLTGKVVFYSESNDVLNEQPLLLYRTSGKNGIYHYSKSVMFKDDFENAKTVSLVVENSKGASTYPVQLKVSVTEEATVTRNSSSFDISYLNNIRFITSGSIANFYMYGTPGYLPEVLIKYKTELLPEVSVSCMVAENENSPGSYKGSITIPEDAMEILSIQYKLTDPGTPENTTLVEESIQLPVMAMARFVELDNENGAYNNMFLSVISEDPYDTNYQHITENATSITMGNLIPGIPYKYQ
ncbi:MAG TPA: hypothetical protein DDZ89_19915, partial [Clostridiales bacterium]|nr:hypothetical protein [Clostridiales bacterium]